MSITAAMSNASSGLSTTARSAEVVSSNVSNATTPGYGRRELVLAPGNYGSTGGVRIISMQRHMNEAVLADRRQADGALAYSSAHLAFLEQVSNAYGVPGSGYSMADSLASVEAAFIAAAARPDSASAMADGVDALNQLTGQIGDASQMIQQERQAADAAIASDVAFLNDALKQIEDVNLAIRRAGNDDTAVANLMDQRQSLVDQVAVIVPVKVIDRGDGQIGLMTPGGAMLLDGSAAEIGFTQSYTVTPHHSREAGTLSGLTVNGKPVDLDRDDHALSGGRLGGNLEVRDTLAPQAQAELDAFARDLIERFADPAVDPTLAPGAAGLLTDAGGPFDPADEVGLAGRISVNAAVDPAQGGEVWRLRDGLGATAPGDPSDSAGLMRLSEALSGTRTVASGSRAGSERSAAMLLSDIQADAGSATVRAEAGATQARSQVDILTQTLLAEGVDTDQELQNLLLIEQAYAANARVIEAVESMLDALLRT